MYFDQIQPPPNFFQICSPPVHIYLCILSLKKKQTNTSSPVYASPILLGVRTSSAGAWLTYQGQIRKGN